MLEGALIFIPFNAKPDSGLDYAIKTMEILGRKNMVFGLALGDPITYLDIFSGRISGKRVFERRNGYGFFRPVIAIPGQRFNIIRDANYILGAFFIVLYLTLFFGKRRKLFWFFEPFYIPGLLRMFSGYESVYDCVDDFFSFSRETRKAHIYVLSRVDHVFANSFTLERLLKPIRPDVHRVPLGFAETIFGNYRIKPLPPNKKELVAGFIGGISARINFRLLMKTIRLLPRISFVFVGPFEPRVFGTEDSAQEDFERLLRLPNVQWISAVKKEQIPQILSRMDIGLIPYRTDLMYNRHSFPMKIMEYFYSGKPVISTNIEEFREYGRQSLIYIVSSATECVRAIREIEDNGLTIKAQKSQRAISEHHTWERKIKEITRHLAKADG